MTSTTTLVFGAVAILVVVAWFVFGVIDGTRPERTQALEQPRRESDPSTDGSPSSTEVHAPAGAGLDRR